MQRKIAEDRFDAYSFKIHSPSGAMFLVVNEFEGKLNSVQIYIGKTGSQVYAYVNAIGDLINLSLRNGFSLEDIITILSNQTSDKLVYAKTSPVRSDIDSIVLGFLRYKQQKYSEKYELPRVKPILRRNG
jgi:hypothetical protein